MQDTQNKTQKRRTSRGRLVLKSATWTLIALALAAIGYFGAEALWGAL